MNDQLLITILNRYHKHIHLIQLTPQNCQQFLAHWILVSNPKTRQLFDAYIANEIKLLPNYFWEEVKFAQSVYTCLNKESDGFEHFFGWREAS